MDYEKKYKDALERARIWKDKSGMPKDKQGILDDIFPELKDSEDERIKKAIVATIHLYYGESLEDEAKKMIAWLEKQGEYKSPEEVLKIRQELYQSGYNDGYKHGCEDTKKQGEQKPTDNDMKEALRTEYEKGRADAIAEMQKPVDCTDCTNSKGCINCEDGNMKETLVQNPAWSEEDETIADNLALAIANDKIRPQDRDDYCDWLKSLKDRYTWKPSDEQLEALADALSLAKSCGEESAFDLRTLYEQLKKL